MSYATYITDAYVCGTFNRNTADRSYLLFTREAGMLFADAKSVREERSKQRYALQDFSRIRVSLVKGKQGWRVGSVEVYHNDFMRAVSKEARGSVVTIHRLLRRFIRGEEASPELFDFVATTLDFLVQSIEMRTFVAVWVEVQVLRMLGYVDDAAIPESVRDIDTKLVARQYDPGVQKSLSLLILHAVDHSQL